MQDALKERIPHIGENSAAENVYRKQRLNMGLLKAKSMVVEESTKQKVANEDLTLPMLKEELFGNQEIKRVDYAAKASEVREDQHEALPKVGKRRSKSVVPCTSQGRLFEYSKHPQALVFQPMHS